MEGLVVHLPSRQECFIQSYSIVADARDQAGIDFTELDNGVAAVTMMMRGGSRCDKCVAPRAPGL